MAMRIGAAACLAVALLVLCWVSLSADDAGGPVPPLPLAATVDAAALRAPVARAAGSLGGPPAAPPRAVDGPPRDSEAPARAAGNAVFALGASGDLELREDTAARLDELVLRWNLSAPDADWRAAEQAVQRQLPPLPARQAVQWLRRWVDYSAAQESLWMSDVASAGDPSLEQVGQRLQRLVALRRAHFGAEAARTLFAAQEQADAELLASLTTR